MGLPATATPSAIAVGDRIVSVDGVAMAAAVNLDSLLAFSAGRRVMLRVATGGSAPRDVAVMPISTNAEKGLLYRAWVESRRAYVATTAATGSVARNGTPYAAASVVVVISPTSDFSAATMLRDERVQIVMNEDPSRGMFSSIQTGLSITEGDPLVILPGDMPFVSSGTVTEVVLASIKRQRVVVPSYQGQRGHPIAIPSHFRKPLLLAPPATTLKQALSAAGADVFELPDGMARWKATMDGALRCAAAKASFTATRK